MVKPKLYLDFNEDIRVGCETHFFFMEIEPELNQLIDEYLKDSEYGIIETIIRGEKGTRVLEIFVDNKDGIHIEELARINKGLNELIDTNVSISTISNIVISSPGIDRGIKYLWQLHKHNGRILEIELINDEKVEGKLIEISETVEESITLEILHKEKGKKIITELRKINFKDIKEAKVKISFSKQKNIE